MEKEIKPIGKDVKKVIGFSFGMYRYQVEHFDHNKDENIVHDDTDILKCKSHWDTIHGTKIYKFSDSDFWPFVWTTIYFDIYLSEEDVKRNILKDKIEWKEEDPYDFKELFLLGKYNPQRYLYPREKGRVEHGYKELEYPYEKCPYCGRDIEGECDDFENAIDVFNSGSYFTGEYTSSYWEEIHRCPHCKKLFFISEDT